MNYHDRQEKRLQRAREWVNAALCGRVTKDQAMEAVTEIEKQVLGDTCRKRYIDRLVTELADARQARIRP